MIFREECGGVTPVTFANFARVAGFFWPEGREDGMASHGNIRTQTLGAFSVVEMNKIVAMLPAAEFTATN